MEVTKENTVVFTASEFSKFAILFVTGLSAVHKMSSHPDCPKHIKEAANAVFSEGRIMAELLDAVAEALLKQAGITAKDDTEVTLN